jgi:two-component system copper resistance phosphate regulon response regulator CusR
MRVLVVEDEARLAESIARGLRQAGHAVDVSGTMESARQKVGVDSYGAVVLDVNLPDGSGFDLVRELRARGDQSSIILLTARDGVEDRVAGLDAGADDYLVKPFAQAELLARLRALQRRPPAVRPTIIEVGDLALDPRSRSATRAGQPVELTATEYSLLEYLALHMGEACGRAAISAYVWDENYDPLSNIIDVYIARLRRKLEFPDRGPLIHTLRGAGYTLDPSRGAR